MARDRPAHESRGDELADADAGLRSVVGNDGEIALALPHQFVDRRARACRQPMKPPIMRLAPSGIMATAFSHVIVFMSVDLRFQ